MLDNNEVVIWHGRLSKKNVNYPAYWRILAETEKTHAAKIKNNLLQMRYVEVHGRVRSLLGQTIGQLPEKISIKKTKHGKPYLEEYPDFEFNIAHSNDRFSLVSGWHCRLGIDVEVCKPRNNLTGLVNKCFALEEQVFWKKLPENEKINQFYRFWTRKEAFVKATGYGIVLGLNRCVINPENPMKFIRIPKVCGNISEWYLHDIDLGLDVCSALVANKKISNISLVNIKDHDIN